MEAIVLQTKSKAETKFWLELAKKTGTRAKAVNTEEMEDAVLAFLIEKGMKTGDVRRADVMKALGR
ncbi:MAG: hypothetical protein A2X05_15560 [Bacteroidetes bacterium GWE2_41_25]|nr:MAG: hypothetical protein A2X05_15560 [Bacteroidetes bacterium GWE2_41_25]HBH82398.1 hypothetical protein [Bacteroidales bacterium]HCU21155.1 hypothetical protein [Bacteroidales bacterium]